MKQDHDLRARLLDEAIALAQEKGVTVQEALYATNLAEQMIYAEMMRSLVEVIMQAIPKPQENNADTTNPEPPINEYGQ